MFARLVHLKRRMYIRSQIIAKGYIVNFSFVCAVMDVHIARSPEEIAQDPLTHRLSVCVVE